MSATKLLPHNDKKNHFKPIFYLISNIALCNNSSMTGKELKEWRKENGLTQVELSKILGVTWSTVARWEIDYINIPPYLHLALATITRELNMEGGDKSHGLREKKKRKKVGD